MATFALVHGAGDTGWYWHLTEAELQARGHQTIAPDLPCDNETASLGDYASAVIDAVSGQQDLVIVGQSYGSFTATLAAARLPARLLVLLAGMIPAPGETPGQWWDNTGYGPAVEQQAKLDGRSMRGRTCPPGSSWPRTTTSSPPPSCGGWPSSAWASSRTRFPAVTAPRLATRRNSATFSSATSTDLVTP